VTHVLFHSPSLAPVSGGGRVIVDWALVAAGLGWRATIATPDGAAPDWSGVGDVEIVPHEAAPAAADVVVATIWWTAWHCAPWQRRGARAAHLVQGNEQLWATRPEDRRIVRAALRAIQFENEVRKSVDHSRRLGEARRNIDHPEHAQPRRHAIQVSQLAPECREESDGGRSCRLVSLVERQIRAHLAQRSGEGAIRIERPVPREVHTVASAAGRRERQPHARHRHRLWQDKTQRL